MMKPSTVTYLSTSIPLRPFATISYRKPFSLELYVNIKTKGNNEKGCFRHNNKKLYQMKKHYTNAGFETLLLAWEIRSCPVSSPAEGKQQSLMGEENLISLLISRLSFKTSLCIKVLKWRRKFNNTFNHCWFLSVSRNLITYLNPFNHLRVNINMMLINNVINHLHWHILMRPRKTELHVRHQTYINFFTKSKSKVLFPPVFLWWETTQQTFPLYR